MVIVIRVLVLAVVIVPLFMAWLMSIFNNGIGSNGDWLGFWGGYLGAIVGVAGTVYITLKVARLQAMQNVKQEAEMKDYDTKVNLLKVIIKHRDNFQFLHAKIRALDLPDLPDCVKRGYIKEVSNSDKLFIQFEKDFDLENIVIYGAENWTNQKNNLVQVFTNWRTNVVPLVVEKENRKQVLSGLNLVIEAFNDLGKPVLNTINDMREGIDGLEGLIDSNVLKSVSQAYSRL
ncbi:hypothetical protein FD04_GL001709 [Secundilactobacillus odoratitofui DSM 19909 = JCM 15043]|uniref:Uncharacterized protein n=1 Tax=Secundilactobacillus odoratitofui DSM 19909 = JCM 15043 TaxID=1423776 RepID=A0A0R1LQD2_9LACO|nr:hypothetical protein FD04_GL001709 [Secundilactobacillus odoratitofui DSM 19909 = JCM 15043]